MLSDQTLSCIHGESFHAYKIIIFMHGMIPREYNLMSDHSTLSCIHGESFHAYKIIIFMVFLYQIKYTNNDKKQPYPSEKHLRHA